MRRGIKARFRAAITAILRDPEFVNRDCEFYIISVNISQADTHLAIVRKWQPGQSHLANVMEYCVEKKKIK